MKIILSLIFSIWGLFAPESVVVDNSGGYFISNMGKLHVKDGNVLYQSKEKNEYILSLVDPRGLYLNGKDLWIVDFDRLIKYDLSSKTYKSYFATFPRYLNDVTMYEGKIYVTDTYGNSVYILENDKLNVVFNILRPNGITTDGKYLYVISFENPAVVYKCSKEGVVESFTLSDVKGGDGIFFADDLFFVSGYNSKNVVVYDKEWNKLLEKNGFSSPSDLYYKDGYLYVPDMKDGKIYVFQVKKEKSK
ncbi:DNA-binding beta-propeller fold protein YncE [Thermosipho japonicus]|uniref:DNA-binding beta-propeller fold protein YncE n=1 Tax=Thermosipho japonicus TaxID=90323 RepID=A0A841GNZ7_9BACT|nr:hypothetical protein [Thermosipho japonicus]MBB6062904.1 DNA-binding beta-propeller fold protein YncE [Thermosipho japonicus]